MKGSGLTFAEDKLACGMQDQAAGASASVVQGLCKKYFLIVIRRIPMFDMLTYRTSKVAYDAFLKQRKCKEKKVCQNSYSIFKFGEYQFKLWETLGSLSNTFRKCSLLDYK